MLWTPRSGCQRAEHNIGTTSAAFGTAVVAGGVAHQKNATYTTIIAATAYDAYGIFVSFENTGTGATATNSLVDIAIGAASSEVVIIPDLIAGSQGTSAGAQGFGSMYYFPIFIKAGSRISGTAQSVVTSKNVNTSVYLLQHPQGRNEFIGSRVTAYGINSAASRGTIIAVGNGSYVTGQVSASTANAIKYIQIGIDQGSDTNLGSQRGLAQILTGSDIVATDLPFHTSTTLETVEFAVANMILAQMTLDIPAGIALTLGGQRSGAAENLSLAAYGVC